MQTSFHLVDDKSLIENPQDILGLIMLMIVSYPALIDVKHQSSIEYILKILGTLTHDLKSIDGLNL